MRIGMFTDSYFPREDGCSYTIETWKKRLEARGHEVYVFHPSNPGYESGKREIPVSSIPNPFHNGHRFPLPVRPQKMPELDIVHCHSPGFLGVSARYYAWKNSTPTVFSFHTPLEDYIDELLLPKTLKKLLSSILVKFETFLLEKFDKVTSNTEEIERRNVESVQVPAGIDMEFFKPTDSNFVEENSLERPVAAYSGRVSEEKNLETIIEMAENFEGTVLIVGNGRHEERLKKQSGDNVVFKDFLPRDELPEFYSDIDVFVHASGADTFSLTTLEANACGTPVVAPDVYPFNETIRQENGRKYSYRDSEELLDKVEEVISTGFDTRSSAERYSVEKSVDKLEKIYRNLSKEN